MSPTKPLDLPPAVARDFVKDMHAFFAEEDKHKQDEIAAQQLSVLNKYRGRREDPLRLSDINDMFRELKGVVG